MAAGKVKPLPLLLYSYIAAEMLAPFFASFLVLYSIFFLVRLVPLLDLVLDLKIGFTDFIRLFSYIFPHMLYYVIPMASMAGVIIAFTRMSNDREILVFKTCGINLRQLLLPVIIFGLSVSLLTGFFSIRLIPAGNVAMKQLMFQLAKEKIDKGLQQRTFTEALGDLVIYVDRIDRDENWQGVYVSDMRNRQQPLIIMAREGNLRADIDSMTVIINLTGGTMHNTAGSDSQIIHFEQYQVQVPIIPPTQVHGEIVTRLDRGSMTQQQLMETAGKHGYHTHAGVVFLTEYHDRLALPVGCFILILLSFPLGMKTGPGRLATGIPLGLFFFIFYYVVSTFSRNLAESLILPVFAGMWLPNLFFLILTIFIFRRAEQEKPLISRRLQNRGLDLSERYLLPPFRITGHFIMRSLAWRPGHSAYGRISDRPRIHACKTDRLYHLPGCEFYDSPQCTISFKDARVAEKAGFKPCRLCGEA